MPLKSVRSTALRVRAGGSRAPVAVGLIFVLAVGVRVWGTWAWLPFVPFSEDESFIIRYALRFGTGDLNPHWFVYPSFYMYQLFALYGGYFVAGYLVGAFDSATDFYVKFLLDPTAFYLIARVFTAILGALTVVVVYRLGERINGGRAGVIAALFMALLPVHVEFSQMAKPDILMTFLVTLSLYFSLLVYQEGKPGHYYLAGLLVGLAAGAKYPGIIAALPLAMAHLLRYHPANAPLWKHLSDKRALVAMALIPLGFFIVSPFSVLDFNTSFSYVLDHLRQSREGWLGSERSHGVWLTVFSEFLPRGVGVPLLALAMVGLVGSLVSRQRAGLLLASFPLLFYLLMANSNLSFPHYWIPLFPVLMVLAARVLVEIARRWPFARSRNHLLLALVLLVALQPAFATLKHLYDLGKEDTRLLAKEWVESNVPPGTRIALEWYATPLVSNRESILAPPNPSEWMSKRGEEWELEGFMFTPETSAPAPENRRQYALIAAERRSPGDRTYYVYRTFSLAENPPEYYAQKGFSYLILSSYIYQRYLDSPERYPTALRFYGSLEEYRLVKEFIPDDSTAGPTLRIYRAY